MWPPFELEVSIMADLEKVVEMPIETKFDMEKLRTGLENLTGRDYISAERTARSNGEKSTLLQFTGSFHAALAAKAMGVTYTEVCDLPVRKYTLALAMVTNFLFGDLAQTDMETV